jgi:hypothetical protein
MPAARFESATPAGKRSQVYTLHRSATGIGIRSPNLPARS